MSQEPLEGIPGQGVGVGGQGGIHGGGGGRVVPHRLLDEGGESPPAASRGVAQEWRKVCAEARGWLPRAWRAARQASCTLWRGLGYVEGQNLVIEYRYGEGKAERLREVAAELVQLPVDVIVARGASGTRGAQRATRTIPIVMTGNYDPVGEGFVASLARPGGNITGLSNLRAELISKQLEFLKETVPQSTRIAVLANPASPGHAPLLHNLTVAAEALKLSLHVVEVRRAEELDDAFAAMVQAGADALVVFAEPQLISAAPRTDCGPRRHESAPRDVCHERRMWRPDASCPTGQARSTSSGASPSMWTRSCKVPSRPTCPWSSRRSSSWSSISRPPRPSA